MSYVIRRCVFQGPGHPVCHLIVSDKDKTDRNRKAILGYRFGVGWLLDRNKHTVFAGEDFHCSPLHATDSDETMKAIMDFVTLKPGDTDDDYFKDYTQEQLDFVEQYADALYTEVHKRWRD